MSFAAVGAIVLGQWGGAGVPPSTEPIPPAARAELVAAASASPRPPECQARRSSSGELTIWDRARDPTLAAYCDSLARGYAELARVPGNSLRAAERAAKLLPKRAAPWVLAGRAELGLGRHAAAWKAFERARSLGKRSVEEPAALHDMATAALGSGQRTEALAAYRSLVPRASLLPDVARRQRLYVEAALVVMNEGAAELDEAVGYLTEARRQRGLPGLSDVVLGALALALDRLERGEEARGVAAEAGGPFAAQRLGSAPATAAGRLAPPLVPPGELHAVTAMLAEREHPELAKTEWRAYLDGGGASGPWAAHARRHLDALNKGRKKPGGR